MTKTVASLCPWEVKMHRSMFTLRNTYSIPAVPKGQPPATTIIEDNIQWEKLLSVSPAHAQTILGEHIAADFVLHVAQNGPLMSEDARPAVWICEGQEPSTQEIAENMAKLRTYCGLLVEQADDLDRRRIAGEPHVPKISDRMKDGCRFLDLKREWLTTLVDSATTCQFCSKSIPATSAKCQFCHEIVNRRRYDELKKELKSEPVPA